MWYGVSLAFGILISTTVLFPEGMYPSCPFALYGPRVKGMNTVLVWLVGGSNLPLFYPNDGIAGCGLRLVLPVKRCLMSLCSRVVILCACIPLLVSLCLCKKLKTWYNNLTFYPKKKKYIYIYIYPMHIPVVHICQRDVKKKNEKSLDSWYP